MKARALEQGEHRVLNGAKTSISNGINADVIIVAAKTRPDNPHGVTLFVVERGMDGFVRHRKVFGRPLRKMQNTRFRLAASDAELDVGQVYVDRCVEQHNLGKLDPVDAARAKLYTRALAGCSATVGACRISWKAA